MLVLASRVRFQQNFEHNRAIFLEKKFQQNSWHNLGWASNIVATKRFPSPEASNPRPLSGRAPPQTTRLTLTYIPLEMCFIVLATQHCHHSPRPHTAFQRLAPKIHHYFSPRLVWFQIRINLQKEHKVSPGQGHPRAQCSQCTAFTHFLLSLSPP